MESWRRTNVVTLCSLIAVGLLVIVGCFWHVRESLKNMALDNVESCMNLAREFVVRDLEHIESVAESIATNAEVIRAIQKNDTVSLGRLVNGSMEESGLKALAIVDGKGTVLARGHSTVVGDTLDFTVVKEALADKKSMGVEPGGPDGAFSFNAAAPVIVAGSVAGAVVASDNAVSDNKFVDKINMMTGTECTIFQRDRRMSTTITDNNGKRAIGTKLDNATIVNKVLKGGGSFFGPNDIIGKTHMTAYVPLKDASGNVVGMLFVGQNMERLNELVLKKPIIWASGAAVVLLTILVIILFHFVQLR